MTLEEYHQRVLKYVKDHKHMYTVIPLDRFYAAIDDENYKMFPMIATGFRCGFTVADTAHALMIELNKE